LESVGECFVFYGIEKVLENVRHIVSVWDRCEIEWGTNGTVLGVCCGGH
jgi:hypothetical protein